MLVSLAVEASDDCVDWVELRHEEVSTNTDILLRRLPCSAKFIRFSLTIAAPSDLILTNIDVELYHKLFHRMR